MGKHRLRKHHSSVSNLISTSRDPGTTGRTVRRFQAKTLGDATLPLQRAVGTTALNAATQRLQLVLILWTVDSLNPVGRHLDWPSRRDALLLGTAAKTTQ